MLSDRCARRAAGRRRGDLTRASSSGPGRQLDDERGGAGEAVVLPVRRRAVGPRQRAERDRRRGAANRRAAAMLGPHARTTACGWWNQSVSAGRMRRIRLRAARVSGSESGRGPEYCGDPRPADPLPERREVPVQVDAVRVPARAGGEPVRVQHRAAARGRRPGSAACAAARRPRVPAHSFAVDAADDEHRPPRARRHAARPPGSRAPAPSGRRRRSARAAGAQPGGARGRASGGWRRCRTAGKLRPARRRSSAG